MNNEAPICYIHVGMHKTGTTSIQRFLALNRKRFVQAGLLLPLAACDNGPDYVSHHQLAYELSGSPLFDPRHGGLARLGDELRASVARRACISSENLSLLWHAPACFVRLRDVIIDAGFRPAIVCYVRPQASFCPSVYAQLVSDGGYRKPFPEFLRATLAGAGAPWPPGVGPPFIYTHVIDALERVFGHDAIILRRYRSTAPDTALISDFTRLIAPAANFGDFTVPPLRENGSVDFGRILALLSNSAPLPPKIRFSPLGPLDVLRFGMRYGKANVDLARRYGVWLPAFEWADLVRSLPLRGSWAKTRALRSARRALAQQRAPALAVNETAAP